MQTRTRINAIRFTIWGNHENIKGNPIGYTRVTQRSRWNRRARRYEEWKDYVWLSLLQLGFVEIPRFENNEKVIVECMIYFTSKRRPDPGNVVKGIVDALADKKIKLNDKVIETEKRLYPNDRNVIERVVDFDYSDQPRVEVMVRIKED